jgi:hypothetical protein
MSIFMLNNALEVQEFQKHAPFRSTSSRHSLREHPVPWALPYPKCPLTGFSGFSGHFISETGPPRFAGPKSMFTIVGCIIGSSMNWVPNYLFLSKTFFCNLIDFQ